MAGFIVFFVGCGFWVIMLIAASYRKTSYQFLENLFLAGALTMCIGILNIVTSSVPG